MMAPPRPTPAQDEIWDWNASRNYVSTCIPKTKTCDETDGEKLYFVIFFNPGFYNYALGTL